MNLEEGPKKVNAYVKAAGFGSKSVTITLPISRFCWNCAWPGWLPLVSTRIIRRTCCFFLWLSVLVPISGLTEPIEAGPLFENFKLTLSPGERTEVMGPLYYFNRQETTRLWASPPLFSYTLDEGADWEEFDFLYPLLTYDRFGPTYRFQILQLFSFSGGGMLSDTNVHRFTLFPLYFQQRSEDPDKNYTAVFPFYGRLKNRIFRDEIDFVLWPAYVKTRRRAATASDTTDDFTALPYRYMRARKGDITTYNYLFPFVHLRYGSGLRGWQVWPFVGREHKEVTHKTNAWEEVETISGHDKLFAAWPLFYNQTTSIGTTNPVHQQAFLPFYSFERSPQRDSTTYVWPLGFTQTDDRERQFHEIGAPWPFIVFTHGKGKTTRRVWPFFSQAHNDTLQSDFYLWPVYKYNRVRSEPLDRRRTRLFFFLYSDLLEKNTETGAALHRWDFWPFYTRRRDFEGKERLQVLSILEPFLPNSKSIERDYSPLWALWRAESNPQTGAASQSLLWNLYRHETAPHTKKCSLLFGLFQYQSTPEGKRWRLFYVPVG
jgi:hypothetical protein